LVMNRYVSAAEEALSFSACDVVLLPYINHFGASGVLGQAVGARKPVIVSDEQLLGRLTRDHGLGWLFASNQAADLGARLREASLMDSGQMAGYAKAAEIYSRLCSREAYRRALVKAVVQRRSEM
ncbi:MAG: glycosyltransferase, partial [Pedosphaera sp.]|nr:glycosyltransferase [Pedosphaera sp.]